MTAAIGCSKRAPVAAPPAAAAAAAAAAAPAPASSPAPATEGEALIGDQHGKRKLLGLDVPVFVDGEQRAALRYGDLPSIPAARSPAGLPGWSLERYLAAIGVPVAEVRAVHLYGTGTRFAGIAGRELATDKRFVFSFLAGETGAPLTRWDTSGLANVHVVHEIRRIAVYVKKEVPPLDAKRHCLVDASGACIDLPLAKGAEAKGTRVYLDGRMVGFVKRRLLGDALLLGPKAADESATRFSVAALVEGMGVARNAVRSVALVAGDDVIGRADASAWSKVAPSLHFTAPNHGHGKIRVHVPASMQAKVKDAAPADADALVTAILVFSKSAPPTRPLVPISDETDLSVQLAGVSADTREGHTGSGG